ncbi:MAG: molybdate ABC transporter substrate-binding protein [Anaerolineae bacterium]
MSQVTPAATTPVILTISAAASLTFAFEELGTLFEQQTGIQVEFNFGATGQLLQQIQSGADVDIFAASDEASVDTLEESGNIIADTKQVYAVGRLTLWTRADSALEFKTIEDVNRPEVTNIAMANPDTAPYGLAAREAMQSTGIWEAVQSKLVFGENVSQTLQYADSGNVDVAFVPLSLSIHSNGKWVLLPTSLHQPVRQALAVVKGTTHEVEARQFVAFLNSADGQAIMQKFGFESPNNSSGK